MPVRAITFDWWGTLFCDAKTRSRGELRLDILVEVTGADRAAADNALKAVWAAFDRSHRMEQRTLTSQDAVRMACEHLNVHIEPDEAERVAEAFACAVLEYEPLPIEGALEAVRAAAARVPIGIISDTGVSPGRVLRQLMDRNEFTQWFSAFTWSDELGGLSKPRSDNYLHAAAQLNVPVESLLHIGDLPYTDIAGAKAVNAKAALFTAVNQLPPGPAVPDYTFATWREFVDLLPRILSETR